ncbi:hypothetical protein HHI36_012192 [Cryptolaemus montrouzieri]|uniref:Uncharacterized protein n=1 Tax=Cryptolaemus montrouzieri TaxID=559131 RepID=A0ABD2NED4_9CUCU
MCTKVATPNLKDNSGNLCKSPVEVANVLADFFAASFTSEPDPLPNSTTPRNLNELCDIQFTSSLVEEHLTTLDTTFAPGKDNSTKSIGVSTPELDYSWRSTWFHSWTFGHYKFVEMCQHLDEDFG